MLNIQHLIQGIPSRLVKQIAKKKNKNTQENLPYLTTRLQNQIAQGLKISKHFEQRVMQRFEETQEQDLIAAICRCIKNTKPLEFFRGNHLGIAQKYIDEATNIVIVLERMGEFGANLITTYILGKENLLNDEEVLELNARGVLC